MIVRRIWHGWRFRGVDSFRRTTAPTTARPPPAVQIGQMTTPFDYVIERFVAPQAAVAAPERVTTPVTVTKRGSVIHGRK
jgi:hypothetical protein